MVVTLGAGLLADRGRAGRPGRVLTGLQGMRACRGGAWRAGGGGWRCGPGQAVATLGPAPEIQELGEVVHGAQELDLGVDEALRPW